MTKPTWRDWLEPAGPAEPGASRPGSVRQWLWFAGLAVAGAGVVAVTAYALRGLLLLAQ